MLILFDIDGTLTATSEADNGCYERAFFNVFRVPLPTTDWHVYTHVTDVGIVREVMESKRPEPVTAEEITQFERAYVHELELSYASNPSGFAEVPGAKRILESVVAAGFGSALSTGGFRGTQLFKLKQIGVDGGAMPGAFANDAISRADIARIAIKRAGGCNGDVVYVGDGLWDLFTAAELGIRFVGITRESSADRLRSYGANSLLEDYRNSDAFFAAIHAACVPERV